VRLRDFILSKHISGCCDGKRNVISFLSQLQEQLLCSIISRIFLQTQQTTVRSLLLSNGILSTDEVYSKY